MKTKEMVTAASFVFVKARPVLTTALVSTYVRPDRIGNVAGIAVSVTSVVNGLYASNS